MSDLRYWLALNFLSDIGSVLARRLLSVFGNPENIFHASIEELKRIEGVGENRANSIVNFDRWELVNKEIEKAHRDNIMIVTLNDTKYPSGLKHIPDAPPVLYVKGELEDSDKYAISIVGSRRATSYGIQVAEKMSYTLASYGLTVVSGMARGIDTASHRGALKARGRTVAVLGSGVDVPYPPSNKTLMKMIESSGAVISEFPLGTPPNKENFPKRNRIISGLSLGVVVIEATLDSGSFITVGYALDQGKEVFAVPGNITSENSRGTNDLIKKGARLVESAEEIIDELKPQIKGVLKKEKIDNINNKMSSGLNEEEKALCNYLTAEPTHIDSIIRATRMAAGKVLSVLLNLELKGVVRQSKGKYFSLNYTR
jgi:DNA processing protein